MSLTGMSVKDWKEALDFSTRKVKSFGGHEVIILLRKEDRGGWRCW